MTSTSTSITTIKGSVKDRRVFKATVASPSEAISGADLDSLQALDQGGFPVDLRGAVALLAVVVVAPGVNLLHRPRAVR